MAVVEKGNHKCLSEDWLLDNLPEGWTYDCYMGEPYGFLIYPPNTMMGNEPDALFIPLDLLKTDRRQ
jgi:hypothetical protein